MIGVIEDSEAEEFLFRQTFGDDFEFYDNFTAYLKSDIRHEFIISDLNTGDNSWKVLHKVLKKEDCPFYIYTSASKSSFTDGLIESMTEMGVVEIFEKRKDDWRIKEIIKSNV